MPDLKTDLMTLAEFRAIAEAPFSGHIILLDLKNSGAGFYRAATVTRDPMIGDKTYRKVGKFIRRRLGHGDYAGRIAGDCFAILVAGTRNRAQRILDDLRSDCGAERVVPREYEDQMKARVTKAEQDLAKAEDPDYVPQPSDILAVKHKLPVTVRRQLAKRRADLVNTKVTVQFRAVICDCIGEETLRKAMMEYERNSKAAKWVAAQPRVARTGRPIPDAD